MIIDKFGLGENKNTKTKTKLFLFTQKKLLGIIKFDLIIENGSRRVDISTQLFAAIF